MLRCVIVDDEPLAIQLLSDYVRKTPDLELAEAFSNPIEALQYLQG
jgi:DNA-binding LytR/AlgR family response regulator